MNRPVYRTSGPQPAQARLLRPVCTLLLAGLLAGCTAGVPPLAPEPPRMASAAESYLSRAARQPLTREGVTVRVAALRPEESEAVFGAPLAQHGVQPVWIEIENRSRTPYWFMPVYLDRDFYSAREVAFMLPRGDPAQRAEITTRLVRQQARVHVAPGEHMRGFVYTNLSRGVKLINVQLMGDRHALHFDFARELPDTDLDYQHSDATRAASQPPTRELRAHELRAALAQAPCCTTNAAGDRQGDPLNLVLVGTEHDVLVGLVRAGWDFTDTIQSRSVLHLARAFVFGEPYRNSPVSALYVDGRPQDFAMQRARANISQRNHLRLWRTSWRLQGQPVWLGQISRDIGVKVTTRSPTLTTHVIDPDVDEARDYLLQDLLMTNSLSAWGYAEGVGAAAETAPRHNLGDDPYFTDGRRLVLHLTGNPRRPHGATLWAADP